MSNTELHYKPITGQATMFYIGMSRATTVLIIVAHEAYREMLEERRESFDIARKLGIIEV